MVPVQEVCSCMLLSVDLAAMAARADQEMINIQPSPGADIILTESERYEATMVLGAVGDAMGYHNGHWEFCYDGSLIHEQVARLGGVAQLKIKKPGFIVSDDTILHIATAEGLCLDWNGDLNKLYHIVAKRYQARSRDMGGRAPGATTMSAIHILRPDRTDRFRIPFNRHGGGCGAAIRSVPIGLAFPRPEQLDCLIAVAIETGRMTHNHPTGYLGSLAVALFVSYALQGKSPRAWGAGLMETLEGAWQYVERTGIDVEENKSTWGYFKTRWNEYLDERGIADGQSEPTFPERYGVKERDQFYRSVSFDGWGGASGHDAPMIAYDAILGAGRSWEEVCKRAVLHGGDSDSTGIIACALWGAMHGFRGVPENNCKKVEFGDLLRKLAGKLRKVACPVVQIFRSQLLGRGWFADVYVAKADGLPCAAKLLHKIPFRRDPLGLSHAKRRFKQECEFLSAFRHPHIVKYLGTSRDPQSGCHVLLIERGDKSLTHFLEHSPDPLPYHLEVNLCHDVAMALDYLHSRRIMHRDLSSDNVLLFPGNRAKVIDFGKSKLLVTLHMTPQAKYPGKKVYMPPEALRFPAVYDTKLDCFSFGVLSIQIMTRLPPDPEPARQGVFHSEHERRKRHINLISPNHPLLWIARRCLEDHHRSRPSAQELCDELATLQSELGDHERALYDTAPQ